MHKESRPWLTTVGAALVLVVLFGLLALLLYRRTERGVVEKHSQDQQLLAQLAALALTHKADSHLHRAEVLAARLEAIPEQHWEEALATLPEVPPDCEVFLLRPDGHVHFREAPENPAAVEEAARRWLGSREPVLTSPIPVAAGTANPRLALMVPGVVKNRLAGQVGLVFPVSALLGELSSLGPAMAPTNLALLDEQGKVLANSRHPEMVGRRIPPEGQNCLPCHADFSLERRMLTGEAGVTQLQVAREPLALLAYTPVSVLGRRWSLSLSEPYSAIVADTYRGFQAIVLTLGLSLVVGIVAIGLTLQYRLQQRRAEERAALAERQAALEAELRQNEQLAALGTMTSQIAHQINTPLAALSLNVAYLQGEVARRLGRADSDVDEVSRAIAGEIERLKHVVNDYLRFSRLPQPAPVTASLRETVESVLAFIEPEARARGVQLEVALGDDLAQVELDTDLFRQALLNLVRNSLDAMPRGGTLRVTLDRCGEEVILRLGDTGAGIPPEVLPRIFDPFFTTKKDGTGLGLAHTRRVVEQHGGWIDCQSAPGQGTTFTVRLPGSPAPAERLSQPTLLGKGR